MKNVATGKYVSCSNISGCEKCISATKCISCSSNLFLVKEDDNIDSLTCKDINENQYYQVTEDDITFYKKCTMSHCEECTALDHCTKCEDNYVIIEDVMILKQLNINYVPLIQIHAKNVKWMMIIILYA